ncbi:hypothetical protein [Azospirillum sp. INR13]|nr:hypothetical protein [Azospirillum sp. INR13]
MQRWEPGGGQATARFPPTWEHGVEKALVLLVLVLQQIKAILDLLK